MAITIQQAPEALASMHDDLWHVVTSNNTGQEGFKYVFDVYVAAALVARVKLFPDPVEDCGTFNAGGIVRSFWQSYFKPNTTQTAFSFDTNDIYVGYSIQFGEEYGGTLYTNLATANYQAFNFYNPIFRDWSTSYLNTFVGKWLTFRDRSALEVGFTEKLYVPWFNYGFPDVAVSLKVATDGGGVTSGSGILCDALVNFDLSPAAINTYLGTTKVPSTATQYTVQIGSGDILTIRLACNRHDTEVLHFLNSLGGYETAAFRLVNRESRTAERQSFQRPGWEVSGDSMTRYDANKRLYPGRVDYAVRQAVTMSLTSDWLSETDHNWMRDLIMSPEVYLERGGYYYPVTIATTQWAEKIRRADKLFNLTLDINVKNTMSQIR